MKQPWIVTVCCCCCTGSSKRHQQREQERDLEKFDHQRNHSPTGHHRNHDASLAQMAIDTALNNRSRSGSFDRNGNEHLELQVHQQTQQHYRADNPDQNAPPPSYDSVLKDDSRGPDPSAASMAELPAQTEGSRNMPAELHSPVVTNGVTPEHTGETRNGARVPRKSVTSTNFATPISDALVSPVGPSVAAAAASPFTASPPMESRRSLEKQRPRSSQDTTRSSLTSAPASVLEEEEDGDDDQERPNITPQGN